MRSALKAKKLATKLDDEEICTWKDTMNDKIKEAKNEVEVLEE